MNISIILSVGIGGFLGAILRFVIASWVQKVSHSIFPFGTLSVNILGSFIIGFLFLYFQHINISTHQKAIFVTGLLGALTTFSTFSWESMVLIQNEMLLKAVANIGLNIILSLLATLSGILLFKKIYGI